jgi:hypothetical protein
LGLIHHISLAVESVTEIVDEALAILATLVEPE